MVNKKFDAAAEGQKTIQWIKEWFDENGKDCNAVIGISGGKDSSVVAALCVKALGKDRVIGVQMPNGEQKDIDASDLVFKTLGIRKVTFNIEEAVHGVLAQFIAAGIDASIQTMTNLPCRIRMATLYAISQSLNGRVLNTCNLSEDVVGWSTFGGDDMGAISPLGGFTVQEILEIGDWLQLPKELVYKTPSDGLCGETDEDKFGFTYVELDDFIRNGSEPKNDKEKKMYEMYKKSFFKHKLIQLPTYLPNLPMNEVLEW